MFWFYIIVGLTLGVHSGVSIFIEVPYTRPNERIHTITIPLKTAPKDPTTPLQQPTQHQAPSRPLYEKKTKQQPKQRPKIQARHQAPRPKTTPKVQPWHWHLSAQISKTQLWHQAPYSNHSSAHPTQQSTVAPVQIFLFPKLQARSGTQLTHACKWITTMGYSTSTFSTRQSHYLCTI